MHVTVSLKKENEIMMNRRLYHDDIPITTDFSYYGKLLENAHMNLKSKNNSRVLGMEIINRMNADPTYVETLKSDKVERRISRIYIVRMEHVIGCTFEEASIKMGISPRTIGQIRLGEYVGTRAVIMMLKHTEMTLEELVTPENFKSLTLEQML